MRTPQKTPDLTQIPINNWVNAHEVRPVVIRSVEVREKAAMGICSSCADKDCLDCWVRVEVECKGVAEGYHRLRICVGGGRGQGNMVEVVGGGAGSWIALTLFLLFGTGGREYMR